MAFNLMDAAKTLFSNELVNQASTTLGENESGISKALHALIPTTLMSIINTSGSTDGANTVAQLATEQYNAGTLSNLVALMGENKVAASPGVLGSLFNNKSDLINTLIAQFSGVKSSTASSLLSWVAPAVLSLIGKHASTNNLNASSLSSWLGDQKDSVKAAVPAGFSLGSIFGESQSTTVKNVQQAAHTVQPEAEGSSSGLGWLVPIFLLIALAAAALYFFKDGCNKKETAANQDTTLHTMPTSTATTTTASVMGALDSLGNWEYNLGNISSIKLPDGVTLEVGENSTEAKLVHFLQSNDAVDTAKGNWFEFTNVRFNTGSSTITDASLAQLKNMVAIAKAFPNARFKVGGYTDNTGDEANNVTLSKNRAAAVAKKIVELGAPAASIVGSDGYGSQYPLADNATAEGKAQNRRVSVNVKAK